MREVNRDGEIYAGGGGRGNEVEKERKGRRDRGRKKVDVSFLDSENSNRSPIAFPSFCFVAFAATKQRFIGEAPNGLNGSSPFVFASYRSIRRELRIPREL